MLHRALRQGVEQDTQGSYSYSEIARCYHEEDPAPEDRISRGLDSHLVMAAELSDAADSV